MSTLCSRLSLFWNKGELNVVELGNDWILIYFLSELYY